MRWVLVLLSLTVCFAAGGVLCGCGAHQRRREAYVTSHPWESNEEVLEGKITVGMSKDAVLASWGSPLGRSADTGPYGTRHETWTYHGRILHFEDGVLTGVSEGRRW